MDCQTASVERSPLPEQRPKHVLKAFGRFWSAYERWLDDPNDDLHQVTLDELYCRYAALDARWRLGIG